MRGRLSRAAALVLALLLLCACGARPVLTCGEFSLDNTQLGYYYWSEYFYYAEAYGDYLKDSVDFSRPLGDQPYDQNRSWEDFLLEETVSTIEDTMTMVFEAEKEGFTLPRDYDSTYQQVLVNFASAATQGGYPDLESYLRASYGPKATEESFRAYLYQAHLAAAFADWLYEQAEPAEEEVRAYFAQRQREYVELLQCDPADESTWMEQVRQDLWQEQYRNEFLTRCSRYEFVVNREAVRLTPPAELYDET